MKRTNQIIALIQPLFVITCLLIVFYTNSFAQKEKPQTLAPAISKVNETSQIMSKEIATLQKKVLDPKIEEAINLAAQKGDKQQIIKLIKENGIATGSVIVTDIKKDMFVIRLCWWIFCVEIEIRIKILGQSL